MLKMERHIDIDRFDYDLPDERIAKYPLEERSASKLLVYERGAKGIRLIYSYFVIF